MRFLYHHRLLGFAYGIFVLWLIFGPYIEEINEIVESSHVSQEDPDEHSFFLDVAQLESGALLTTTFYKMDRTALQNISYLSSGEWPYQRVGYSEESLRLFEVNHLNSIRGPPCFS